MTFFESAGDSLEYLEIEEWVMQSQYGKELHEKIKKKEKQEENHNIHCLCTNKPLSLSLSLHNLLKN